MRIDNVTGLTTPALYCCERAYFTELVERTALTTADRIVFATHQVD